MHSSHVLETILSQLRFHGFELLRQPRLVSVRMITTTILFIVIFDAEWHYFRAVSLRLSDCVMMIDNYRLCHKLSHVTICRIRG